MKKSLKAIIKFSDEVLSSLQLKLCEEKKSLIIFAFHGLFFNKQEIDSNQADPQERITVGLFRRFIDYYLTYGYTFTSPEEILNGLGNDKKYILVSFDDGYFSTQRALPILREYQIPAVFFISTSNVQYNKCFWWDVLYRARIRQGRSLKDISSERQGLMSKTTNEIEDYIRDIFGEKALRPISDIDRPFTPAELREFSKEKYVSIGNHTADHAILTNYCSDGIKSQILDCQNTLYEITGTTPVLISYPCGVYSDKVIEISKAIGLRIGVTVEQRKNYLPINWGDGSIMRLGRFTLSGQGDLVKQCETFRSGMVLYNWIKNL